MAGKSKTLWSSIAALAILAAIFVASAAEAQRDHTGGAKVRTGKSVVGQWTERIKLEDGGTQVLQVTAFYDWTSGRAYREFRDDRGRLAWTLRDRKAPRPFPEEIQQAFDKVYRDRALGPMIRQQRLEVDGGFLLEQAPGEGPCGLGSRCIQVFLFDGLNVARQAIVDLKTDRIVYRNYVPTRNRESR